MRDPERGRDIGRGRSGFPERSLITGLDPRAPGSRPEPKADTQPLSHLRAPLLLSQINKIFKKQKQKRNPQDLRKQTTTFF